MSTDRQARLQAEARAKATLMKAMARAESLAADAGASARGFVRETDRKMRDLANWASSMAFIPTQWDPEDGVLQPPDETRPPLVPPDHLLEAVSVRAYYKAEQRGFWPGYELDDWLEAEKEILRVSALSKDSPES